LQPPALKGLHFGGMQKSKPFQRKPAPPKHVVAGARDYVVEAFLTHSFLLARSRCC
jgi:hypothetical protein